MNKGGNIKMSNLDKLRNYAQSKQGVLLIDKEQEILFSLTKMLKTVSKRDQSISVLIKGKATWENRDGEVVDGWVDSFIKLEQLKTENFKDINAVWLNYVETLNANSVKGDFIVKALIVERESKGKDGKTYQNKKLVKIASIVLAPVDKNGDDGINWDEKGE